MIAVLKPSQARIVCGKAHSIYFHEVKYMPDIVHISLAFSLSLATAHTAAKMSILFGILQLSCLPTGISAFMTTELDECIKSLPQCVQHLWESNQHGDATNEEELSFGLLGAWMKSLYTKKDAPYLASDLQLRASTLMQLQDLARFSLADSGNFKYAIGVGQMLFLYFWWGLNPPGEHDRLFGPSIEIASLSANLHTASLAGSCSLPSISHIEFEAKKCPWRWRFVLLLLVEVGKQLAVQQDLRGAVEHFRLAEARLKTMRMLPYFAEHRS